MAKIIVERWARISSTRRGWIEGQIDRRLGGPLRAPGTGGSTSPSWLMSSRGTSTRKSQAFLAPPSTIVTGRASEDAAPAGADDREAAEQARDLVERALRRREPDALERPRARRPQRLEPLEREEQVRAALGGDQRVDLVDDHRLHRGQDPRACEVSSR